MIYLSSERDNFTLHENVCNLILVVFLAEVCNLKLLFSRKHPEDVLVFFSHLEINGRILNVGRKKWKRNDFSYFKRRLSFDR